MQLHILRYSSQTHCIICKNVVYNQSMQQQPMISLCTYLYTGSEHLESGSLFTCKGSVVFPRKGRISKCIHMHAGDHLVQFRSKEVNNIHRIGQWKGCVSNVIYWVLSQFHLCIYGLSTKAGERSVIPKFTIHACNWFMCTSKVPDICHIA